MKEAIGTSMVFSLILIFTGVFIALLIGSLAYSKGFKVRNRIIDVIEQHNGYTESSKNEINENLAAIGYKIVGVYDRCKPHNGTNALENDGPYDYCIYEYKTSKGKYYGVTVYIHFDFPIVGSFINIPLYGETRIIFEKSEVIG